MEGLSSPGFPLEKTLPEEQPRHGLVGFRRDPEAAQHRAPGSPQDAHRRERRRHLAEIRGRSAELDEPDQAGSVQMSWFGRPGGHEELPEPLRLQRHVHRVRNLKFRLP